LAKNLALFTQNTAKLCKKLIITLFFLKKEKGHFFAENRQKSLKLVSMTLTPELVVFVVPEIKKVAR
jgi:hypothetical protein